MEPLGAKVLGSRSITRLQVSRYTTTLLGLGAVPIEVTRGEVKREPSTSETLSSGGSKYAKEVRVRPPTAVTSNASSTADMRKESPPSCVQASDWAVTRVVVETAKSSTVRSNTAGAAGAVVLILLAVWCNPYTTSCRECKHGDQNRQHRPSQSRAVSAGGG